MRARTQSIVFLGSATVDFCGSNSSLQFLCHRKNDYYGSINVGGGGVLRWKQNEVCESRGCSFLEYDEYSSSSRVDAKALFIIVLVGDT